VTLTVTPTVNLASTPPSVSLAVSDSTGTVTSVTVQRFAAGGASGTVRTSDGGPLPLTTSGSTKVGTLIDTEPPYGVPVSYSVNGGIPGSPVTVAEARVWLVHPFNPGLSMPLTVSKLPTRSRAVSRGMFKPLGRKNPIPVTDGARQSSEFTMGVRTHTPAEQVALDQLLDDASTLLLNVPVTLSWGVGASYISVGDLTEDRTVNYGPVPLREWSLPFQVVDSPISGTATNTTGGGAGTRTWADLSVERVTWANAGAAYSLWSRAEAGTPG
jgi:hypothetical protein